MVVIVVVVSVAVVMIMVVVAVGAADMIVIVMGIEEMRIVVERPLEIEGATVEHLVQRNAGALGAVDAGARIDGANGRLDVARVLPA